MTNKLDLSLDDIIKINKKVNKRHAQGNKSQKQGNAVLGRKQSRVIRGKKPSQNPKEQKKSIYGTNGGVNQVRTRQGGRRGKARGRQLVSLTHTKELQNKKAPILTRGKRGSQIHSGASRGNEKSGKLLVTNLDFGVSDDDIKKLFSSFGAVRRMAVHYDRSGKSLGSAEVHFQKRVAASKALEQYNGVSLDGRAMRIHVIDENESRMPQNDGGKELPNAGNLRRSQRSSRGASGKARGRGRGGLVVGRQQKKNVSAKDLDQQLDAYISKTL